MYPVIHFDSVHKKPNHAQWCSYHLCIKKLMDSWDFQMIIKDILVPYKLVADLIIQSQNWGSLTFSHNEIASACNISHIELGHLEQYCYWQTLFERLNGWQWHQASNLTPIPLITLNFSIYYGKPVCEFTAVPGDRVISLVHKMGSKKILQVAALMTVLHVGNKNSSLAAVPYSVFFFFFFWKPSFW